MFCPRCASNQSNDVKFCTVCGANLVAVRQALDSPEPEKKFDWGDTWVAEMFMSPEVAERRRLEIERRLGITPEVKRYNEIKAGVITSSVGVALAIFLFVFMQGLVGNVSSDAAEILSRLWVAGVIPFFVGMALIVNGLVVSKKQAEIAQRELDRTDGLDKDFTPRSLRPADTSQFIPSNLSVTDQTTRHLADAEPKQRSPKDASKTSVR
jgi:hypothetical protein